MKHLIIIALCTVFMVNCKKSQKPYNPPQNQPAVSTPCPTPAGLTNILWKPVLTGYINLAFGSDGTYYEDQINTASIQGTWRTGCPGDSIVIQKQFYKVQYRIVSLSSDTLKLINPVNFINTYYK